MILRLRRPSSPLLLSQVLSRFYSFVCDATQSYDLFLQSRTAQSGFLAPLIEKLINFVSNIVFIYFQGRLYFVVMASSLILHNLCSISAYSSNCYKNQTLALSHSRFLYSNSFFKLKRQSLLSDIQTRELRTRKPRSVPVVYAAQSNFFKGLFQSPYLWFYNVSVRFLKINLSVYLVF